ncbi:MAG: glycosyltransferase [Coriobacteriales bacterium]|jgi:glycosyltransferase involved in cell wall biosynthesis/predicted phosphodiesterase|nr:glycosyltransferase [Coriobacteriales bacterium]
MTEVSVLMPVYNAAAFVRQAVQSVLEQTYGNLELICIDDKSTDGSLALLRELAAGDARMTLVEHAVNQGVGATRSELLSLARGTYLLFVDADDYLELDALALCLPKAKSSAADLLLFKLGIVADPLADFALAPPSLSARHCFGLWEKTFAWQDIPERIFQLGANLNATLLRADFVREAQLDFAARRVGDGFLFMHRALIAAKRVALANKVLCRARWWHGGNLTQATLGDPRRYYPGLLDLRQHLESLDDFAVLERSYVNSVADTVARELEAQWDFDAYTAAARFYRASGFDALGILGYPEAYYFDPRTHAAVRRVVLGDVYGKREQLARELEAKNARLEQEKAGLAQGNKQLTEWLNQWRTLDRELLKRFAQKLRLKLGAAASRLAGGGQSPTADLSSLPALIKDQRMNATTGYRFSRLCDELLSLDDAALAERRQALVAAVFSLKSAVQDAMIYGERAISASNKVYGGFLSVLVDLLRHEGTTPLDLRQEIENLKALQVKHTHTTLKLAFNLEEEQIFPSFESVYAAAAKDPRCELSLIHAPLGKGVERWKSTDASLCTESGPLPVKQKSEYDMFRESPDILFVTRPHINQNEGPLFSGPEDVFEITPAQNSGYRTVYLPYGFFDTISETAIDFGYQHAVHPVAWKIIAYSTQILANFKKYSALEGKNAVLMGAPRFDISSGINGFRSDELTAEYKAKIRGRRALLWNPHYTNTGRPAQMFLNYLNTVLEFFKSHEDLVLFWRPHPKLFGHLVISDLLTQRELDAWLADLEAYDNIIVDKSKDYINAFALSNAMLTDGDSSLPYEYIATGKAVHLVFLNGYSKQSAKARYKNQMPRLYYHYPVEELPELLEAFAQGDDPLRETRLRDMPQFIFNNDGHTGERVWAYLHDELFAAEDALVQELLHPREAQPPLPRAAGRKGWIVQEAERVAQKVAELKTPDDLVFVLLTDTHATAEGTWGDTARAISLLGEKLALDGVIHLGDFTDGELPLAAQRACVKQMLGDLRAVGAPVFSVLGECDSNALNNNPDPLSLLEQSELNLGRSKPHYQVDIEGRHTRLIFLDSFDTDYEQPFGYSEDCIAWLRCTLAATPPARRVVVFSHLPPEARLMGVGGALRGQDALKEVLGAQAHRVLAFIHGHTHADSLDNEGAFPVVSLASATCEGLCGDRPQGALVPQRARECATQECWDVLLVNPVNDTLRFVRFGATPHEVDDRLIEEGRAAWV